mgnify:CR=1 FL=1
MIIGESNEGKREVLKKIVMPPSDLEKDHH